MDNQFFISELKKIIEIFSQEKYEQAIDEAKKLQDKLIDLDEKKFVKNIENIIYSAYLINNQELDKALEILEKSYTELKTFSPNYKGLKVENLIQNINQSIIDIKSIIKK
ncbi:MAG: hypothetical protein RMJ51_04770 [Candidatus Calescibacterium sp.]|nr:hypothetical protein [Candidatus Calescibacterium sp.]MCX7972727.1 hypothetical protein [bacterium]MDW8195531.1 hypothetical protein [Candidatus Calescibacterium sp.]